MLNERRSQAPTPVVVAKDNLKQTEGHPLQNKKKSKMMSTYLKQLTRTTDRVNYVAQTQCLKFPLIDRWKNETKNDG